MVKKLIWERIIEIIVVIALVLLSIPVWKGFQKRISEAHVMPSSEYELKLNVNNTINGDLVNVNNKFYKYRNYKVGLKLNKETPNDTQVIIDNVSYDLQDFTKEGNIYTIIIDDIFSGEKNYNIKINSEKKLKYSYVLEEI